MNSTEIHQLSDIFQILPITHLRPDFKACLSLYQRMSLISTFCCTTFSFVPLSCPSLQTDFILIHYVHILISAFLSLRIPIFAPGFYCQVKTPMQLHVIKSILDLGPIIDVQHHLMSMYNWLPNAQHL